MSCSRKTWLIAFTFKVNCEISVNLLCTTTHWGRWDVPALFPETFFSIGNYIKSGGTAWNMCAWANSSHSNHQILLRSHHILLWLFDATPQIDEWKSQYFRGSQIFQVGRNLGRCLVQSPPHRSVTAEFKLGEGFGLSPFGSLKNSKGGDPTCVRGQPAPMVNCPRSERRNLFSCIPSEPFLFPF